MLGRGRGAAGLEPQPVGRLGRPEGRGTHQLTVVSREEPLGQLGGVPGGGGKHRDRILGSVTFNQSGNEGRLRLFSGCFKISWQKN